jgi:DNA-binding transcriptional LysR family regulator
LDVAILHPPVPEGIQTQHLVTKPRIACLPADDELASRSETSLAELADRRFVDVPPQVPRFWWDFWAVDPRPDGSRVRYGPVVSDLEALLHTVAEGIAIAFLPDAARDLFPRRGISYVKVADLPPYASALAWPAANRNRPSIAAIRQVATALVSTETW